jgi:hypothetical protein
MPCIFGTIKNTTVIRQIPARIVMMILRFGFLDFRHPKTQMSVQAAAITAMLTAYIQYSIIRYIKPPNNPIATNATGDIPFFPALLPDEFLHVVHILSLP